jgi:serine/threonine-protein kinase
VKELDLSNINQDLLLAALALLTGAVPREMLRAALLDWAENPDRPLPELLRDRGSLDEERVAALKCLVSAHLRNHNGDVQASLDAWNAQALAQDMVTEIERTCPGSVVGATLSLTLGPTMGATTTGSAHQTEPRALPSFTQDQRFVRIGLHAKGGIGEVWLARDQELQRDVALKEIQPRFVDRRDQRDRFLLEAEITGNLEHPGIVPVYSLGRNAEGRPYYAMRFIRGESLSAAIKRFHQSRKREAAAGGARTGSPWGVEFQQLLRRFLDVCDAIEYAHSRKVIHRDLKPGNIMLGQYGETLVVDWGLAKIVGKSDIVAEHAESGNGEDFDPSQARPTASVGGDTQPGTTIGTPSYMSPEQARGAIEDLGPVSDVYSLGATLYELLAGTFPFPGKNAAEIIAKVKTGELTPPRVLEPSLPPQLEAICLKAMAFQPQDRYQSARELALDLEHWMADEPVAAFPEQRLQKLARWLRRHRTWTYAAAAALVGITVVATAALFVVDNARRSQEEARKEAESNFKLALRAVDNYLTNVSENTLLKEQETHDIRTLREALLQSALPFYQDFVQQRSHDPQLRQQLANAYFRLGDITLVIGTSRDALKYYRSALELWEPLANSAPDNIEFQSRLADCCVAVGKLTESEGYPEALSWLTRALQIYQQAAAHDRGNPKFQASQAACCSEIGLCLSRLDQFEKSLGFLNQGRAIQDKLVQLSPDNIDYKKGLAEIVNRIGDVDFRRQDFDAGLRTFEEFHKICQEIIDGVKTGPKPLRIQITLATSYYNIGAAYLEQSKLEQSLAAYKKAEEIQSRLASQHSTVVSYQRELGLTYLSMAIVEYHMGRPQSALASIEKAMEIFDRMVKAEPEQLDHLLQLGRLLTLKSVIHDEARRNDLAQEPCERALEIRRALVRRSGNEARKDDLCVSLANLGETYVDLGQVPKGLPYFEEAVRQRIELCSAHPDSRKHAADLADLCVTVGDINRQVGDPDSARKTLEAVQSVLEGRLKSHPEDAALQSPLARVLGREARVVVSLKQPEQAEALLRRATQLARDSFKDSKPKDSSKREILSEALWDLAQLLRVLGKTEEATQLEEERTALWRALPAADLVNLAINQAIAANVIGYGKTTLSAAGEEARRHDRQRAASSLGLALKLGYKDRAKLRANPDLGPLLDLLNLQ